MRGSLARFVAATPAVVVLMARIVKEALYNLSAPSNGWDSMAFEGEVF